VGFRLKSDFDELGVFVGTLSPPLPPVPRPSRLRDRDGVVDEDEEDDEGDAAALEAASCAANLVLPAYGSWGTSLIGRRVCPAPKREKKNKRKVTACIALSNSTSAGIKGAATVPCLSSQPS